MGSEMEDRKQEETPQKYPEALVRYNRARLDQSSLLLMVGSYKVAEDLSRIREDLRYEAGTSAPWVALFVLELEQRLFRLEQEARTMIEDAGGGFLDGQERFREEEALR